MKLVNCTNIFYDYSGSLYIEDDIELGNDICFYKPLDVFAPEASCGIYVNPKDSDYRNQCIYYNYTGESVIYNLDLDFEGYLTMAGEAFIFRYWPKVLVDIKYGRESEETKDFRDGMKKMFHTFDWEKFVEKYESLRLSKRNG